MLLSMPRKVILTFEPVDEIVKCDHSKESYSALLSYDIIYSAAKGSLNF